MLSPNKEDIIIDYENESYKHQTRELIKHLPHWAKEYAISLFPIITWIHRYNLAVR
jgi:sodium-independent sulfate anion transporter 11